MARTAERGGFDAIFFADARGIYDEFERWFHEVGVDGFDVKEVVRPVSFRDFVDLVVPELREHGLVFEDDGGETLRENVLGRSRLADDHPGATRRWRDCPSR